MTSLSHAHRESISNTLKDKYGSKTRWIAVTLEKNVEAIKNNCVIFYLP